MRKQRALATAAVAFMAVLSLVACKPTSDNTTGSTGGGIGGMTKVTGTLTCKDGSIPSVSFTDSIATGREKVSTVGATQKGGGFELYVEAGVDSFRANFRKGACGGAHKRYYDFDLNQTNIVCTATTCSGSRTTAGYTQVAGTIVCVGGGKPTKFGVGTTTSKNAIRNVSYNRGQFSFEVKKVNLGYIPKFTGCGSRSWTQASQSWKDTKLALVCSAATACRKAGHQKLEQAGQLRCVVKGKFKGHPNSIAAADYQTKRNVASSYNKANGRYAITISHPRNGYKLWISGCGGQTTKGPLGIGYFVITCGVRRDTRIGGNAKSFRC
jgi:hypothetical protein